MAVISDIHGNWNALSEVLKDIDRVGTDRLFCLGDAIGYGPEPERVVQTLLRNGIPTILGNHELAAVKPKYLSWFNPTARVSLEKSLAMLSEDSMAFISGLKDHMVTLGCRFVHGFPLYSTTTYRFQVPDEKRLHIMKSMPENICFIGHTHDLNLMTCRGTRLNSRPLKKGLTDISMEDTHVITVGSVGQPRDSNNNAKYVIWDTDTRSIEVRYVPYDIADTAEKIIAAGLPQTHANRLW
jgi:predicted phosphodiesterase